MNEKTDQAPLANAASKSVQSKSSNSSSSVSRRFRRLATILGSLLAIAAGWQVMAYFQPSYLFPSLAEVFHTFSGLAESGQILKATWSTGYSVLVGSSISLVVGSLLGYALWRAEAFTSPLLNFAQTVPYLVWALLSVIWFGLGQFSVIFTISVASFPVVCYNVAAGLANVDTHLKEMARSVRARPMMILRHIVIPSLAPYLFSAVRTMIGLAWKMCVLAELFAGGQGIGHQLLQSWELSRIEGVFTWTVWLVVLMLLTDWLILSPIEAMSNRWKNN